MECSIVEYYEALKAHDWYYDWSEDPEVWKRGRAEKDRLEAIAKEKGVGYLKLWEGFNAHYFSGEAWDTEKQPLPRVNEYL